MVSTPGTRFRHALEHEKPLQIIGVMNAYVARMAKEAGYHALYLSGAGVANSSYGVPDLGITTPDNVLEDLGRLTAVVDLPILVDIDTGWGNALMLERVIQQLAKAGAAAVHIEDQSIDKRCGHLPGKILVSKEEMVDRIKAAVQAKPYPGFMVMARTDALAVEGLEATIERAIAYRDAGADMLFPEALQNLDQYRAFKKVVDIPILANLTEFGQTPLLTLQDLDEAGIDMVLYPLSINRLMNQAALEGLKTIRKEGTQKSLLKKMQTREELYHFLHYECYARK